MEKKILIKEKLANIIRKIIKEEYGKQLSFFLSADDEERLKGKEEKEQKKKAAIAKARETRKANKVKKDKELSHAIDVAYGQDKDLFGKETTEKDREDAKKKIKQLTFNNKKNGKN